MCSKEWSLVTLTLLLQPGSLAGFTTCSTKFIDAFLLVRLLLQHSSEMLIPVPSQGAELGKMMAGVKNHLFPMFQVHFPVITLLQEQFYLPASNPVDSYKLCSNAGPNLRSLSTAQGLLCKNAATQGLHTQAQV